jgi:methyl-accepting chemotaxis protein
MEAVLGRLKVGQRLWLNIGAAVVAMLLVLLVILVQFRDSQIDQRKLEMRELVESAYGILDHHGKQAEAGLLSQEQAKQQAIAVVQSLRYGDSGYFWINDTAPVMVMHPHNPEMNGQDLSNSTDPNGKRLFVSFVEAAKAKAEGDIVEYSWAKPGTNGVASKISFVKLYRPWNWVIGTGVYMDDIDEAFWRQAIILGIVVAGIAAVLLLIATLVGRSILVPIRKLEQAVCLVAKHGDLNVRAQITQRGELGDMGNHFDEMLERLQHFVQEVGVAVSEVASASTELATITEQTQRSIEIERSQTTQVATAMTEMSATVRDIAANAVCTADASRDADNHVNLGTTVVDGVTRSINQLADEVRRSSGIIGQLEQDSYAIGKVLEVIRGIAEQTNLLALNAAIEAARAGEQGRGFAVVADEVRGLAQRTQQSTSEIQQMIEGLQSRSKSAVAAMDIGQEQAAQSVEKSQDAVNALSAITGSVEKIKDMSAQIATAAEEQSAVAEDVNQSIIQIDNSATETMTGAIEIAAASGSLAELAERLRVVSSQFHG